MKVTTAAVDEGALHRWSSRPCGAAPQREQDHRIRNDKSAATFKELVGDYEGVIVADALSTHKAGAREGPGTRLAGCWARGEDLRCISPTPPAIRRRARTIVHGGDHGREIGAHCDSGCELLVGGLRGRVCRARFSPVANLKLASGLSSVHRAKDLGDVVELIKHATLPRELAGELDPSVRDKYLEYRDALPDPMPE